MPLMWLQRLQLQLVLLLHDVDSVTAIRYGTTVRNSDPSCGVGQAGGCRGGWTGSPACRVVMTSSPATHGWTKRLTSTQARSRAPNLPGPSRGAASAATPASSPSSPTSRPRPASSRPRSAPTCVKWHRLNDATASPCWCGASATD